MLRSRLAETLQKVAHRSATAIVSHSRLNDESLNAMLRRRLSSDPGQADAMLADPIFEVARMWEPARDSFGALSGNLLHHDLIEALDKAPAERMPRDRHPYSHQVAAWQAAAKGHSYLVTSGTGSGKTECFMVPMLDDLVRDRGGLSGVRAIVIYPLNALIESQRERLAAWTESLAGRVTFALYNSLTPHKPRYVTRTPAKAELSDRETIRSRPPSILITNVTMLEYMLLRAEDRSILESSQGLLRWIVLDEAHGYVGAQAAEMALLLRRVRAAFGVEPNDVRLVATSATISGQAGTEERLKEFTADLAGINTSRVSVIEGRTIQPTLPKISQEGDIDVAGLEGLEPEELWARLASHKSIQALKADMMTKGLSLEEVTKRLFGRPGSRNEAQTVLDAAAQATDPESGQALLPWRAHLFERPQAGFWACVDPDCAYRDEDLCSDEATWPFGQVWLRQRDRCACGGLVLEIQACRECGTPHLLAERRSGIQSYLRTPRNVDVDDFGVDLEPDPEAASEPSVQDRIWLTKASSDGSPFFVEPHSGRLYDNAPTEVAATVPIDIMEVGAEVTCCRGAVAESHRALTYGPPFLIGNGISTLLEKLTPPLPGGEDIRPMPLSGRRAITFSDSRQGVARLAAKLQQDAERTLTRAFLYHAVQESSGLADTDRQRLEAQLSRMREEPELFAEHIAAAESRLSQRGQSIPWTDLVSRLSNQAEFQEFATEVWAERVWQDLRFGVEQRKLAEMFLYRELFRRPRVQNNAETMGLVALRFPEMEAMAPNKMPSTLERVTSGKEAWIGLAYAAIDLVFRNSLAIHIEDERLIRWFSPRQGRPNGITTRPPEDRSARVKGWPSARRAQPGRAQGLVPLVYRLLEGSPDNPADQDRADAVLQSLWDLLVRTTCTNAGAGAMQLDFSRARVARLDRAFFCPVTRRLLPYDVGGISPYGANHPHPTLAVDMPRLPIANAGGLSPEERARVEHWTVDDPQVERLRKSGLWTNLHDQVARYAPYMRAQEHSAQIDRTLLQRYEERFKEGRINLLNCSTTMEMGVDIPNVSLVANANVPPTVANYRQRVGRGGRRGEAWGFAMTYCRNLPLDLAVFDEPTKFLTSPIPAPAVRLDSVPIVTRHVNSALLAAFLNSRAEGFKVASSAGEFFGATGETDRHFAEDAPADAFLQMLRDPAFAERLEARLRALIKGTVREGRDAETLCAEAANAFETLLQRWRQECRRLMQGAADAEETDIKRSYELRARRMRGEFLLGELARRGFTPSYGFPVDVVGFDYLNASQARVAGSGGTSIGFLKGGASRTLDVAIREYAPGSEIVVDGLVHRSEGVQPAWSTRADASGLEDLRVFWECSQCWEFGVSRYLPERCPQCEAREPNVRKTLRPTGFLGRRAPHTGYESLGQARYEMPKLSAGGAVWQSLPDPEFGRCRADPTGLAVTLSSGRDGQGFALCLDCGRAATERQNHVEMPEELKLHRPLAAIPGHKMLRGYCPGGSANQERVQRYVRLVHETRTSVFEYQLPRGSDRATGLAFAAGLREALASALGAEAREIGLAVGRSRGVSGEPRVSAFVFDRAAGGAGLSTRLTEGELFDASLRETEKVLDCRECCDHGCPSCILRPDISFGDERPDRPAAADFVRRLNKSRVLPSEFRLFGAETRTLGLPLSDWLHRGAQQGTLESVNLYLTGAPSDWEIDGWMAASAITSLHRHGVAVRVVMQENQLKGSSLDLAARMDLHRLSAFAELVETPSLPVVEGAPVLVHAKRPHDQVAVTATDNSERAIGPAWGEGSISPVVLGRQEAGGSITRVDASKLMSVASGKASLLHIENDLDGAIAGFGKRFWLYLQEKASGSLDSLLTRGVTQITYSDRYLLTPLSVRLLWDIIQAAPGRSSSTRIKVATAQGERTARGSSAFFNPFEEDAVRREVMQSLFDGATITIAQKSEMPHARTLLLSLSDGSRMTLYFDQGLGAWGTRGPSRHDFSASPADQAQAIRRAGFAIRLRAAGGTHLVLQPAE